MWALFWGDKIHSDGLKQLAIFKTKEAAEFWKRKCGLPILRVVEIKLTVEYAVSEVAVAGRHLPNDSNAAAPPIIAGRAGLHDESHIRRRVDFHRQAGSV